MDIVERSLRLLETPQAGLGVGLAAVSILAALVVVLLGRPRTVFGTRLRVTHRVVLVLGVGLLTAIAVVSITYEAWYRHRCVHHRSDITECYAGKTAAGSAAVLAVERVEPVVGRGHVGLLRD